MSKTITLVQLKKLKACEDQVALFEQLFGNQVEVIPENCAIAYEAGINFVWAVENCLNIYQYKTYDDTEATLWDTYTAAVAPIWEAYKATIVPLEAYLAAEAPIWEACKAAKAQAFCKAYNS